MKALAPLFLRRGGCWLALLLVLGSLPACDSDDDREGEFFAEVRDGERRIRGFEGRALFSSDSSDAGPFVIEMLPRSDRSGARQRLFLARGEAGAPAAGRTYAFARPAEGEELPEGLPDDRRFAGALLLNDGGLGSALYYATSGELEVSAVTEERVAGTFLFEATSVRTAGNPSAPLSVVVEGSFSAERGPTDRFPQ